MIQRLLLRQSRLLSPCIRPSPRRALARPQSRPLNISFAPSSRAFTSSRWLRAESEAKKEDGEAAAEQEEKVEEDDPGKKELEVKNKEIIDLKVCRLHHPW